MKGFYDTDVFQETDKGYNLFKEQKEKGQALNSFKTGEKVEIKCFPTFEITYKEDSGFGVYDCSLIDPKSDDTPDTFILTGQFISPLDIGHSYSVIGIVSEHEGEKQLTLDKVVKIKPLNKPSTISFISSLTGASVYAGLIYEEFKEQALTVIEKSPEKLIKLSPAIYEDLVKGWQAEVVNMKDDQAHLTILMNYGLTATDARKIFAKHGIKSINLIENNPYFLSKELDNYSFTRSDNIAMNIGYDPYHPDRIQVGIMHVLRENKRDGGNIFLPLNELIVKAQETLAIKMSKVEMKTNLDKYIGLESFDYTVGKRKIEVVYSDLEKAMNNYDKAKNVNDQQAARYKVIEITKEQILEELKMLSNQKKVAVLKNRVYDYRMYMKERTIANSIRDIVVNEQKFDVDIKSYLDNYLKEKNIILEKEQYEAVINTTSSIGGFFIIDGSAGCGKTFVLKIILEILEKQYKDEQGYFECVLMAPTGKAAKVMESSTGLNAKTVHRALGYHPHKGFTYNGRKKLPADCIVLDESSMLDVDMAAALLQATQSRTKVIFIGDTKQLSSVGAGNVLKDIIKSNKVNITTLTVSKRQGANSGIIKNAHKIIDQKIIKTNKETKDTIVKEVKNEKIGLKEALKYYKFMLSKFGLENTQVLTPQKTGIIGVNTFNYYIQALVNRAPGNQNFYYKTIDTIDLKTGKNKTVDLFFKKGDKVMNTTNEYEMPVYYKKGNKLVLNKKAEGVMNGDIGRIVSQSSKNGSHSLIVQFENNFVIYKNDFSSLELAYAMTIHKSQGSEWKGVIMPIFNSNYMMLDNHLFYTGYTRAKEFGVVIHDRNGIKNATESYRSSDRYTSLDEQIEDAFN